MFNVISAGLNYLGQGAAMAVGGAAANKVLSGGSNSQTVQGGQTKPINQSPLLTGLMQSADVSTSKSQGGGYGK